MVSGFKTVNQVAEEWGITTRRIQVLCSEGRIEGADRIGRMWLIPEDAKKPVDLRKSSTEI